VLAWCLALASVRHGLMCACSGWPTDPDVPSTPGLAAAVLAVCAVRAGHGTVDRVGLAIMRAREERSACGARLLTEYIE